MSGRAMGRWHLVARSALTRVDLAATFLFAMEGGITASYFDVDIFGVLVLGFSTALVGGIIRDLLIGCTPPASLVTPLYPIVAFSGGAVALLLDGATEVIPIWLLHLTDSLGLSLFAVVGTRKALDYGMNGLTAALLGTVSAAGGGVVRDTLLNVVPTVLRADVYAVAALLGATATVVATRLKATRTTAMAVGFFACFALRIIAINQGWNLPHVD